MNTTIISLVEQSVTALGAEFRVYLPQIIPMILRVFMHDASEKRVVTFKVKPSIFVPTDDVIIFRC